MRVVLSNRVINAKQSRALSQIREVEPDIPDRPALLNIDRVMYAGRYGLRLADSVGTACRKLAPEERLLLLWRYEDGLQLKQIAELLEIHPSNVSRRLDRIHARLREQVVANLSGKHGMSKAAISECFQNVVENVNHGISILDSIRGVWNSRPGDMCLKITVSGVRATYATCNGHHSTAVKRRGIHSKA